MYYTGVIDNRVRMVTIVANDHSLAHITASIHNTPLPVQTQAHRAATPLQKGNVFRVGGRCTMIVNKCSVM